MLLICWKIKFVECLVLHCRQSNLLLLLRHFLLHFEAFEDLHWAGTIGHDSRSDAIPGGNLLLERGLILLLDHLFLTRGAQECLLSGILLEICRCQRVQVLMGSLGNFLCASLALRALRWHLVVADCAHVRVTPVVFQQLVTLLSLVLHAKCVLRA